MEEIGLKRVITLPMCLLLLLSTYRKGEIRLEGWTDTHLFILNE